MVGRLTPGLSLAVVAAVAIGLSDALGMELQHMALLGTALGGVVALVPHRPEWGRLAGFVAGFVLAWAGFALRAALLPDTGAGRAVAALLVGVVLTVVLASSRGRLPLWSGLVGVAALVGAYEQTYTNAPAEFVRQSPEAATTVLLAVALGYLAASLAPLVARPGFAGRRSQDPEGRSRAARRSRPVRDAAHQPVDPATRAGHGVDALMTGEGK